MQLRKAKKEDNKIIKKLYLSAFPANERAPYFLIRKRARQQRAEMLVAESDSEFIGFAYTVSYKDLVYLFYFAVSEEKRGKGNGGKILRLLKEYYPNHKIFLAREPLDETAENSEQRKKRREFYLKNGLIDLPYQIREATVIYDLMGTEDIDPEDYDALIKNWAGSLIRRLMRMEFVR